ncbi:putative membrane protein [Pseudomonas phage vB_PaeP_P1G]|uniref:Membrane protein n=1 Tax=Pseudomonas phage vB_PaeP_P1G TaxID=3025372 RepID=A0AAE9YA88_9CAUD|nr:putative membrane protein [Pseudomonas phage vB_PaeP_P1G]
MHNFLWVVALVAVLYVILGVLALAIHCLAVSPPFENPSEEQFQDACLIGCFWPFVFVIMIFLMVRAFFRGVLGGLRRHRQRLLNNR